MKSGSSATNLPIGGWPGLEGCAETPELARRGSLTDPLLAVALGTNLRSKDNLSIDMLNRPAIIAPAFGWNSSPVDGRRWEFFAQLDEVPDVVSMTGADPVCIRTPKMARVEAALLVTDSPLSIRRLMQLATLVDVAETKSLIEQLNQAYDRDGTAFRIERVASGYRLLTRPQFAFWLGKVHHRQAELKLSPPALETLAIVAYRQPATRAEIESVRRVQCADMLKQLMDRSLVRICGEENSLGRPFLYGTTRQFLELFGLRDLDDLPNADSLRKKQTEPSLFPDPDEVEAGESAA